MISDKIEMKGVFYGHYGGILKSRIERNAISDSIEEKINKVINAVKMEKMLQVYDMTGEKFKYEGDFPRK